MIGYGKLVRPRGFTLLEMMLVVLIIGMLAAAVAWNFAGQGDKARISTTKKNLVTLQQILTAFQLEKGQYPQTLQALMPEFAAKISKDGWNRDFVYYSPAGDGRPYALFSQGPDGAPGGADDINVWTMDDASPQAN
jgi:general secretion pathway protein G